MKTNLTQRRIKEVLRYNPNTGFFKWKIATSVRVKVGDIAGHVNSKGYRRIKVDKIMCLSSHLAWFYTYGVWPSIEIDHRNRIKNDDRIENLRNVSRSCNLQNCGMLKNNKSGVKGVCYVRRDKRWTAQIKINNKKKHLGVYVNKTDAVRARLIAEEKYGFLKYNPESSAFLFFREP